MSLATYSRLIVNKFAASERDVNNIRQMISMAGNRVLTSAAEASQIRAAALLGQPQAVGDHLGWERG